MNKQEIETAIEFLQRYLDDEVYTEQCISTHMMAISALTQQLNNGWIPVSEKLPKEDIYCFVTIQYKDNEPIVKDGYYQVKYGFSWSNVTAYIPKVIWPKKPYNL
jgi:hypothetical protein